MSWIRAAHRDALRPDLAHVVTLPRDAKTGRPREALVVVDPYGAVRAYLNICQHIPIPLDGGSREFFDASGTHLRCGTHGALYRREDGYCFVGPCRGTSLRAIAVEVDASGAIWIDPG